MINILNLIMTNSLITGFISGLMVALLIYLINKMREKHRAKLLTKFWNKFTGNNLSIIFTEYEPEDERLLNIAEKAGGKLMTKGMAMAVSTISKFAESKLKNEELFFCGDKSWTPTSDNYIVIGSQASNNIAKNLFEDLEKEFLIPYWIDSNLEIHFQSNREPLIPEIESGGGKDYAIVLKASYQASKPRDVIFIGGCHMYASHAAAKVITDTKFLKNVFETIGHEENVIFIIEVKVSSDEPYDEKIYSDNHKKYIEILEKKKI